MPREQKTDMGVQDLWGMPGMLFMHALSAGYWHERLHDLTSRGNRAKSSVLEMAKARTAETKASLAKLVKRAQPKDISGARASIHRLEQAPKNSSMAHGVGARLREAWRQELNTRRENGIEVRPDSVIQALETASSSSSAPSVEVVKPVQTVPEFQ